MKRFSASLAARVALAFGLPLLLVGCGDNGTTTSAPAQVAPEQEKKTNEMLQNYGKMQADAYKAKAAAGKK